MTVATPIEHFESYVRLVPDTDYERWQYLALDVDQNAVISHYNVVIQTADSNVMSKVLTKLALEFPHTAHWQSAYSNLHLEEELKNCTTKMLHITPFPQIIRIFMRNCQNDIRLPNYYVRVMNIYTKVSSNMFADQIKYHGSCPKDNI